MSLGEREESVGVCVCVGGGSGQPRLRSTLTRPGSERSDAWTAGVKAELV